MTSVKSAWPALLVIVSALMASGAAAAGQQQASFSVAVTLHRVVKPLSAAQLCKDGRPIQSLGAMIQIDCPQAPQKAGAAAREATLTDANLPRPEVTVTF